MAFVDFPNHVRTVSIYYGLFLFPNIHVGLLKQLYTTVCRLPPFYWAGTSTSAFLPSTPWKSLQIF